MNAPATNLDASTDLEEFEPDLAEGGGRQIGVAQHLGPQHRNYEMGESREPQPELVVSNAKLSATESPTLFATVQNTRGDEDGVLLISPLDFKRVYNLIS